jgi:hypothetical protein
MTDIEKLAKQIMAECEKEGEPVTKEEALEMAEMEINAKADRHYERSVTKEHKATKRERKIDPTKQYLITEIKKCLEECECEIKPLVNETDLHFTYEGNSFTVKLTKHRVKGG